MATLPLFPFSGPPNPISNSLISDSIEISTKRLVLRKVVVVEVFIRYKDKEESISMGGDILGSKRMF